MKKRVLAFVAFFFLTKAYAFSQTARVGGRIADPDGHAEALTPTYATSSFSRAS